MGFLPSNPFTGGTLAVLLVIGFWLASVVNAVAGGKVVAWGDNSNGQRTVPLAAQTNVVVMAAGGFHNVALKNDGTLVAWGDNSSGQRDVPLAAQSGVMAIAGGYYHSVALRNDGTVVAWGNNDFGQTNVPAGLNAVVAIATGGYNTVALKNDGTVVAWGYNAYGQTNVPAGLSGVVAIAAGYFHTVALKSNGSVVTWGDDRQGQSSVPSEVQSDVVAIAGGGYHTVALKNDGTMVLWGRNAEGQRTVPSAAQSGVTAIAAGTYHTVALKTNGLVVAWGANTGNQSTVPGTAQSGVVAIAAGDRHSVAIVGFAPSTAPVITIPPASQTVNVGAKPSFTVTATGTPPLSYQWLKDGINLSGESISAYNLTNAQSANIGLYTVVVSNNAGSVTSAPPAVLTVSNPDSTPPGIVTPPVSLTINVGQSASFTVAATGTAPLSYQWRASGTNIDGATNATLSLGVARLDSTNVFTVVVSNVAGSVTNDPPAQLAVNAGPSGRVITWGFNPWGEITVPSGITGITAIAAGHLHTVALKGDGRVVAWGWNGYGQVTGIATPLTYTETANPVILEGQVVSGITALSAGTGHTIALKNDGSVMVWGFGDLGLTTVPAAAQGGVVAVAAGGFFNVVLKNDGTVVAWGRNADGQTNVPAGLHGVVAIAAGVGHTLALRNDGSVVAWGYNAYTQTDVPVAAQSGVVAISAGAVHSVALKSDGTVVAWGRDLDGQVTGTPTAISPFIAVANPVTLGGRVLDGVTVIVAGGFHNLALKNDGSIVAWGAVDSHGQTVVPPGLAGVIAVAGGNNHSVALVPVPPNMAILSNGNNLTLSWSDTATSYRIESALSLSPPVSWSNETGAFQTNGGFISIGLPPTGAQKFYRLVKP